MGSDWQGTQGLADDIRYYGKWMRDEAAKRIGYLYPKVTLPKEYGSDEATVIAWLWVRTVTCPNPACRAQMPLTSGWWISKKKGKEIWIEPEIDHSTAIPNINLILRTGKGELPSGTIHRQSAICIASGTSVQSNYIRTEGVADRMGTKYTTKVKRMGIESAF